MCVDKISTLFSFQIPFILDVNKKTKDMLNNNR